MASFGDPDEAARPLRNDARIAGYNPRRQVSQVALLGPGAGTSGIRVLYETEAQISDVACDGKSIGAFSRPGR